jgi:hypothetical protein
MRHIFRENNAKTVLKEIEAKSINKARAMVSKTRDQGIQVRKEITEKVTQDGGAVLFNADYLNAANVSNNAKQYLQRLEDSARLHSIEWAAVACVAVGTGILVYELLKPKTMINTAEAHTQGHILTKSDMELHT